MPTEIKRSTRQIVVRAKVLSVSPLTVAAMTAFVILHLVSGVMLEHSHASPAVASSALAALDDEAKCPAEVKPLQPSLPYD